LPEGDVGDADPRAAHSGETRIYRHGAWLPAQLYDRSKLQPGMRIDGPAIITELDSTTVVLPHHVATVDRFYNLLINRA
jgi:N-methylhydantoinase A